MLVWEAHKFFSATLGDTCNISSTTIYDGARFTKSARDIYIYRAILEIMRKAIESVAILPKSRIAEYINIIFPTQVNNLNLGLSDFSTSFGIISNKNNLIKYGIDLDSYIQLNKIGNNKKPLILISVQASELLNGEPMIIPLPLKNSTDRTGLINSRITHRSDPFAERVNNELWIWDCYNNMNVDGSVIISYLPYSRNPADAIPTATPKIQGQYYYDDPLDIEENMLEKMFALATLYAMTDDQSADNSGLITAQLQLTQEQRIQGEQ